MNDLAILDEPLKPAKARPINRRVCHAIDLLVAGEARTIKAAADQVGMAREALSRALKRDHVVDEMERRRRRAMERLKVTATGTLQRLMESAGSEHVQAAVALKVSARELEPAGNSLTINNNITPGYIVRLKHAEGPLIEHQRQDEAKPLLLNEDVREP